ncbi:hypothetical protein [Rhizorhapis sp. SPR117]|jgi:hypothetical protein|uniref:hypothetical protein n=1 Tax=Rhizorhapis sp. SPR117 TaxID=2912611 RepID=UPI001F2C38D0|nr:hypothetical protein [Rhizorhapis sp. SPR117]
MLFDENDDNGYQPSPHIARLLEGGQDDEATVRAFIADIFAQRIASHHRDTIESSKWADTLPQFIERAPRIIEVIVIKDGAKDFSIRQVQQITDDLVRLDDTGFVRRYGLEELFAALADAEAAGELEPETPYAALARHLSPDEPDVGARDIDRLILAGKRARSSAHNRQRAALMTGPILIAVGLASIGMPALFRAIDPATPYPLPALPQVASLGVLTLGVVLAWLSFRWLDSEVDPPLPAPVAQWLAANGHDHGVRHWDELYWPTAKRLACRRELLGFTFWKPAPPPESDWPELRINNDPEWDYWEHGAGRPVSERYYRAFMDRIERWHDLLYRLNWTGWALIAGGLVTTAIVPFFLPGMVSFTLKLALVTAFIGLTIPLGLGLHPPLRWMPRGLRRRWFGPLPTDAEDYRDFLLARS